MQHLNLSPVPRDEPFDKITIEIVPRFKESGLSGSEWRHSARIQFWRKGMLAAETSYASMASACCALPSLMDDVPHLRHEFHERARRGGEPLYPHGIFSGEPVSLCFQPSCVEFSTVTYRVKRRYSSSGQLLADQNRKPEYRSFCTKHRNRGDCDRDDAMNNYEVTK